MDGGRGCFRGRHFLVRVSVTAVAMSTVTVAVAQVALLDASGQAFWQGLAINLGLFIILTVSLNLTSGFTGVFSLGQIGFMALGAYASAILTLIDPERYGVLDIRGWQLLFSIRSVSANRRGRAFTPVQWVQYLTRLRGHARALGVSARTIEYTLFHCHRRLQRGRLYD